MPVQDPGRLQAQPVDPLQKQEHSAAESSTAESKEAQAEKIGGPPYSDLAPAAEPKVQAQPTTSEQPTVPSAGPDTRAVAPPEPSTAADEKPAVQAIVPASMVSSAAGSNLGSAETAMEVDAPGSQTSETTTAIDDRSPQQAQRDSDIEMRDAPPVAPVPDLAPEPPAPQAETKKPAEAKALEDDDRTPPLPPPPPPLDQRRQETTRAAAADPRGPPQMTANGEPSKWLLPPLRAEFQGKKCLVLDLDETLVHSSFKVGHID